jgi:hypothetical protein
MLKQILGHDRIARGLFERAKLPFAQADSLLVRKTSPGESYAQQAQKRSIRPVSKGAYVRSLRQGESAIKRTLYRLLLLEYLGLLSPESVKGLVTVGQTLVKVKMEVVDEKGTEDMLRAVDEVTAALM